MAITSADRSTQRLDTAEALNQDCYCKTLNTALLREQLENHTGLHGLMQNISDTRPNLFSSTVVFISHEVQQQIEACIAAIERVATLSGYQAQALQRSDPIAHIAWGPLGVCMGYDFHLSAQGAQLIEINTNAGGLMLNAALAQAQVACCDSWRWVLPANNQRDQLNRAIFDMFVNEWRLQRGTQVWASLVIVDDAPHSQYLAPEFELFRQLFCQHGIRTQIADPADLHWQAGQLMHQGQAVDMLYNRLTDFYLTEPGHQHLRTAYEKGAVVVTPHPRAHALLADKRNLIALSQGKELSSWGASSADCTLLAQRVPTTQLVSPEHADSLWTQRRQLFFKPVAGFGAKAAYRGDKLTRRVWQEILSSDFVAQQLVPPSARMIEVDGLQTDLKFDLRAFSYAGQVQLLAARIYAGQTTNFRTLGGGFAPVVVVPSVGLA